MVSGTGRRRGKPAVEEEDLPQEASAATGTDAEDGYRAEEFSFVEEADAEDVIDWLAFTETRTERREERRRRSRHRVVALAAALVVLIGGGGGYTLWRWLSDGGGDADVGRRTTVLFQVRTDDGAAVANAVLFRDGRSGSIMAVPPALRVPTAGRQVTLRSALDGLGPSQSRSALSELLGVRLDGSLILQDVAFVSLVDRLGGIRVTVDRDVSTKGAAPLPAGEQRLAGKDALRYATFRAPGESPRVPAARFARVLQALFRVMPTAQLDGTRMLDNLGVIGDSQLPNQRLGAALSGLAANVDAQRVEMDSLPVRGDGVVDARRAGPVVGRLLGEAVRLDREPGPPRVFVEDATGTGGGRKVDAQQAAGVRLIGGGYRYINGGKADKPADATTIEVSDSLRDAQSAGEQVALTLGVRTGAVTVVQGDQIAADIIVVVGTDFRP